MILELDVGNTRAKWRLLSQDGKRLDGGRLQGVDSSELEAAMPVCANLRRVRIASVAAEATNQLLREWVQSTFGLVAEFAVTTAACAGVRNSYPEPGRMGVDRWLAMLAAYQERPANLLVIDAGSALTIDVVAADGQHLGGYIVPGLSLMELVLQGDTGRVRFQEDDHGPWRQPGCSTAQGVKRGAKLALCGAVELALTQAADRFGGEMSVFVAGGDAGLFEDLPAMQGLDVRKRPELVLDGLALALTDKLTDK